MRTRDLRGIGLMVALASGLLLSCGDKEPASQPASGKKLFGVVFQTMNNPFFVDLNAGMLEVIQSHGDELVTLDSQFNSLKQKRYLRSDPEGGFRPVYQPGQLGRDKGQPAAGQGKGSSFNRGRCAGQR